MNQVTELLNSAHKKSEFECGTPMLDNYLHTQAKQDVKRRLSVCFILADEANTVIGYYTLSNASIQREHLSENIIKKLPSSYQSLPVTLLGRLAVDKKHKGKGHGESLLMDALKRCFEISRSSIGSMAVIVDPIDENAQIFYLKYGFIQLPDSGKMFLPMDIISELFK